MKYKAFISYKHDRYSRPFAESLEQALKSYAKPLLSKPLAIFRDEKILVPGQNLPKVIREGLEASEFLIYIASKEAAAAPWVQEEITYWFDELRRGDHFIIVVIQVGLYFCGEGHLQAIDWDATSVLLAPPIWILQKNRRHLA